MKKILIALCLFNQLYSMDSENNNNNNGDYGDLTTVMIHDINKQMVSINKKLMSIGGMLDALKLEKDCKNPELINKCGLVLNNIINQHSALKKELEREFNEMLK